METLTARRVLAFDRRGSSRPVVVDTVAGRRLVKLRGAAQGTGALVAEVVVAALAEALGLRVPRRSLVVLARDIPRDDRDEELADLLAASVGENLGFDLLEDARALGPDDVARVDRAEQAAVLWLDRFVLNLDRTRANPNLLWCREHLWLIDHGAALRFQYDWSAVSETMPREVGATVEDHVFESVADTGAWAIWDAAFAGRLTRATLEFAVAEVPDSFLDAMLPSGDVIAGRAEALRRRRAAYVAFLWKRIQPPRAFAHEPPSRPPRPGGGPPRWLKDR